MFGMASKTIGVKGKVINSQAREVIANVMKFMEAEAKDGPKIPLANYKMRVLAATGIAAGSYRRIKKQKRDVEQGRASGFTAPVKTRSRDSPKSDLCCDGMETLRSVIHNCCIVEKGQPTLQGIYEKVLDSGVGFKAKITMLSRIIKKMGFKWKKTTDHRRVVTESYDMRYKRITYLQQLRKYVEDGRPIIYADEFNQSIAKGQRLVILHAGGKMGFVPNALFVLGSGYKFGENREEMNRATFMEWIKHQLVPNLPSGSVLVIDSAYCNVQIKNAPMTSTKKQDMITWLEQRNINHDPSQTKPELYQIIKQHRQKSNQYVFDAELQKYGHDVLRLPPYHPELNPIKKIWTLVKDWVASRNTTVKLADVQVLIRQKLSTITAEDLGKMCERVDNIIQDYLAKEHLLDMDEFIFNVNVSDSDDDTYSEEEEDDDDICELSIKTIKSESE